MPSNHLILCCPILLLSSIFPSIRVFSNESVPRIRWPKYWCFSFSISPSNEYSELIFFRIDWLDLLAVQRTLKSLLQYHSSKASILQRSAFFTDQLSHPYMTTGKTIALTRRTLVSKVMSLLLNIPSRLVTTFLPRSKRLLISWLQSPSIWRKRDKFFISVPPVWDILVCGHHCAQRPVVQTEGYPPWDLASLFPLGGSLVCSLIRFFRDHFLIYHFYIHPHLTVSF